MPRISESGKSHLIKGSLQFLWEEVKTLNKFKIKALKRIVTGYFKMKFRDKKVSEKKAREISLLER